MIVRCQGSFNDIMLSRRGAASRCNRIFSFDDDAKLRFDLWSVAQFRTCAKLQRQRRRLRLYDGYASRTWAQQARIKWSAVQFVSKCITSGMKIRSMRSRIMSRVLITAVAANWILAEALATRERCDSEKILYRVLELNNSSLREIKSVNKEKSILLIFWWKVIKSNFTLTQITIWYYLSSLPPAE